MFRCKDISEHASAYVDHGMPLLDRVKFRLHLFICHNCRNYIAQFRATITSLTLLKRDPDARTIDDTIEKLLRERAPSK